MITASLSKFIIIDEGDFDIYKKTNRSINLLGLGLFSLFNLKFVN